MDTPKHPTEGGSYMRTGSGELEKVHATEPAPAPVNRVTPDDPHPAPPSSPAPAATEEH